MTLSDLRRHLDCLGLIESARLETYERTRRDLERVLSRHPHSERARELLAGLQLLSAECQGRLLALRETRRLVELVGIEDTVIAAQVAAETLEEIEHDL